MNLDRRRTRIGLQIASLVFVIAAMYPINAIAPGIVPTPNLIVDAFVVQVTEQGLSEAVFFALQSIFAGFFAAAIVGILVGLSMGISRHLDYFFDPYVNALYAVPVSAVVPALVLWFGTGFEIRFVVVFIFSIFPILINTYEGVKSTPESLLEVGRSFGAGQFFVAKSIILPFEASYVISGLRLGIGRAVKGLVIAELLVSVTGIGQLITVWSAGFQLHGVYSLVIILMLLGVVLTWLLRVVERRVVTWKV